MTQMVTMDDGVQFGLGAFETIATLRVLGGRGSFSPATSRALGVRRSFWGWAILLSAD